MDIAPPPPPLRALGEQALAQGLAPRTWTTRLAYGCRLAWHRAEHRRLLQGLAHAPLAQALAASPTLAFKVLHPCHHAGLTVAQRVDRVLAHHQLGVQRLGPAGYHALHIAPEGLALGALDLPGGHGRLPLRLVRHAPTWREGEATLALFDPFGSLLYTLTFSLDAQGALIGSLIGVTPLANIRHLTHLMQGLRPQALMLQAMQLLASAWDLPGLRAVGRAGHVFAGTGRAGRLQFDYDAFWREQGGSPLAADGRLWSLPLQPRRKADAEIPSHKRAQYRRRHAMLDALALAIAAALPR